MTQPKIDHYEAVRPDSIVTATIDGVSCYAFTVRPGDVQSWDSGNIGPNGQPNERAEISYAAAPGPEKGKSQYDVRDGMLQTYDVDYRFKAGFPAHEAAQHRWAVLTQFHPQDDHRPDAPHGFGGASFHDGQITFDDPMGSGSYFAKLPIKPDTWIKLRMAVKWSAGKDGYAKIVDRATGAVIGHYDGQTITAGEYKYVKQGYYRAGGLSEATVYETALDINDGDLTLGATPPQDFATAHPKAEAGRQQLTAQRNDLASVLLQLDAAILGLQQQRDAVQKIDDATAAVLGAGPWT